MQQHTKEVLGVALRECHDKCRFVGAAQELQRALVRELRPLVFHQIAREAVLCARCSITLAKKQEEKNAARKAAKIDQG